MRRLFLTLARAQWEVRDRIGAPAGFTGVVAVAVFALAVGVGLTVGDWRTLLLTVGALVALWVIASVLALVPVLRDPKKSRDWRVEDYGGEVDPGQAITLAIVSRGRPNPRLREQRYDCDVTDPDGVVWRASEPPDFRFIHRFYPENFRMRLRL